MSSWKVNSGNAYRHWCNNSNKNRSALPPKDLLVEQVLQRLIIERLQLQLAERRGIQIDVLTLDQAMRNLARRNNMNLEQFRDTLLQQGLDYVVFRNQIRAEMIIEQLRPAHH